MALLFVMPDLIRHPEDLDSGFRRNDGVSVALFLHHSNLRVLRDLKRQHPAKKSVKNTKQENEK
jgi:hypothetical protein